MADTIPQGWWSQESNPQIQQLLYQAASGQLSPQAAYSILSQAGQAPALSWYTPAPYAAQAMEAANQIAPQFNPALVASGNSGDPADLAAAQSYATGAGNGWAATPAGHALVAEYPTQTPSGPGFWGDILDTLEMVAPVAAGTFGLGAGVAGLAGAGAAGAAGAGAAGAGTGAAGTSIAPDAAGFTAGDLAGADASIGAAGAGGTAAGAVAGGGGSLGDFSTLGGGNGLVIGQSAAPTFSGVSTTPTIAASTPTELSGALSGGSTGFDTSNMVADNSGTIVPTSSSSGVGAPQTAVPAAGTGQLGSNAGLDQLISQTGGNATGGSVSSIPIAQPATAPATVTVGGASPFSDTIDAASAPSTTAPATSTLDTLKGLYTGAENFANAHPLLTAGATLVGGQLLSPTLSGLTNQNTSQENALLANAQPAINAANSMIPSEATGVLPPGAQASVQNALDSDIASIKARYASMGMSGSSAEQQDIANAQNQAAAMTFSISQQVTETGLNALGLTNSVYEQLLQDQLSRQQELQNAFASFAGSLGTASVLGSALSRAA